MPENFLRSALCRRQFLTSAEIVLGRDHQVPEAESFVKNAAGETNGIKIISLTDLPGGNPALPPEGFASFVLERGLAPLAHLAGKDGNRAFLEGRLYTMARLGVENILALTGDAPKAGFLGQPKPVFDLDSVLLLGLIKAASSGIAPDPGAHPSRSAPWNFFAGAVVNPYKVREPDQRMQFYKMHLKAALGASFLITQLGYNLRKLYELKQYMDRAGLSDLPVVANVYVPTATIARMMKNGEVPGCVVPDTLLKRLAKETKQERLERAALMVAAVKDLGFAGAHIGGFGLSHRDCMLIRDRAAEIDGGWRSRIEELIYTSPGEYYLLPQAADGLSASEGSYRHDLLPARSVMQRLTMAAHRHLVDSDSVGARFLSARLRLERGAPDSDSWRSGFWYRLLGGATAYRQIVLGCERCGDCIQDHLCYVGCTVRWCHKGLRNGPCGGSRVDGSCEAHPERPCFWNRVYLGVSGAHEEPAKFARNLIPPRDWRLDRTNALANRLAGIDNYPRRQRF